MPVAMRDYEIGEIAKASGLATSAIRYYERVGLLVPVRRVHGRRRYDETALSRLTLISIAKEMGFSLVDIKVLVDGISKGDRTPKRLRALAASKLPEVDAMIKRARLMKRLLSAVEGCQCPTLDDCVAEAKKAGLVAASTLPR